MLKKLIERYKNKNKIIIKTIVPMKEKGLIETFGFTVTEISGGISTRMMFLCVY